MQLRNKSHNTVVAFLLCLAAVPGILHAGDIKPSVEVEFNLFYNRNYPRPFSFQFRGGEVVPRYVHQR